MGQSIVLSEIKAEVLLENDISSHHDLLLQRYEERIELLSQENKVSNFFLDAGFVHVVEVGQYFITKDTEEQLFSIVCREYTLSRHDKLSQPKRMDSWKSKTWTCIGRPVICTEDMELLSESGL